MSLFFKKNDTVRKIEHDISKIKKKYFHELISSSKFMFNKYITALSVKSVSSNIAESVLNHFITACSQYSDLN